MKFFTTRPGLENSPIKTKAKGLNRNKSNLTKFLLESGTKGHFPLFYSDWIEKGLSSLDSLDDHHEALLDIEQRLSKHQSIQKKMTVLVSLSEKERNVYIKSFFKKVEDKIVDNIKHLH